MPETSQRVRRFTESVIRRMTRVANECGAVNLSQGFPDFDPPAGLCAALEAAARGGPHQYAVTWGAPGFRAALARKQAGASTPLHEDREGDAWTELPRVLDQGREALVLANDQDMPQGLVGAPQTHAEAGVPSPGVVRPAPPGTPAQEPRSEERRGGKGCRYRGSP